MITARRVAMSLLLAAALVGFGYAFTLSGSSDDPPLLRDEAVKHFSPSQGDRVLRQDQIFVELHPAYTGVLKIDGIEIPEDQLERTVGINRIAYTPGPDKETGALTGGRHRATAEFWRVDQSRAQSRTFTWHFDVH